MDEIELFDIRNRLSVMCQVWKWHKISHRTHVVG
jgi:hypothetical protein